MNPRLFAAFLWIIPTISAVPASAAESAAVVTGGWVDVSPSDPEVVAAAKFAMKKERNLTGSSISKLRMISILHAKEQVVAGTNYRIKIKVLHHGKTRLARATVFWRPWTPGKPYQLTEWKWLDP